MNPPQKSLKIYKAKIDRIHKFMIDLTPQRLTPPPSDGLCLHIHGDKVTVWKPARSTHMLTRATALANKRTQHHCWGELQRPHYLLQKTLGGGTKPYFCGSRKFPPFPKFPLSLNLRRNISFERQEKSKSQGRKAKREGERKHLGCDVENKILSL